MRVSVVKLLLALEEFEQNCEREETCENCPLRRDCWVCEKIVKLREDLAEVYGGY